jgi:hypothetical protein
MMRQSIIHNSPCILLVAIVLSGCGKSHSASVSGIVTLDGKPLPLGTVSFYPEHAGAVAYGSIDKNGHYRVRTGTEEGLAVGDYVVTVVAMTPPREPKYPTENPLGTLITPARYGKREQSNLKYTVAAGANPIDIALRSHAP